MLNATKSDVREAWYDYIIYGGLPESIWLEKEDRINYLTNIVDVVYMRDIVETEFPICTVNRCDFSTDLTCWPYLYL